ncbi:MAG: hypothetical protein XD82_0418, partial [Methanoculleus marisnigri]
MNARHIGLVAKKELSGLSSEKTIVFAVLLQVFIAMFSSFLMVGLTAMYDPEAIESYSTVTYGVGYAGADSALIDEFSKRNDLVLHRMDLGQALTALRDRELAAVVYVPDTPPDAEGPVTITLYLIQNDLQSSVINVKVKEVLQSYEKELREVRADRMTSFPIGLNFPESGGGENFFEFVYGLLIPLLVLLPAIVSAALIIDLITEEYQRQTLETLMSTPVTFAEMDGARRGLPLRHGRPLQPLEPHGQAVGGHRRSRPLADPSSGRGRDGTPRMGHDGLRPA